MNNIFEQEAILDMTFKTIVAENANDFKKSIITDRVQVKGTDISGDVYVGRFFSLLDGTAKIDFDFKTAGSGGSSLNSIIVKIKNLDTEEIQSFLTNAGGSIVDNKINLNAKTKYEITVNVGSGTTMPVVYLTLFDIYFSIKTKPEKYIISEQA